MAAPELSMQLSIVWVRMVSDGVSDSNFRSHGGGGGHDYRTLSWIISAVVVAQKLARCLPSRRKMPVENGAVGDRRETDLPQS